MIDRQTVDGRHQTIRTMTSGYKISTSLFVAANLGICDALRDGPLSMAELAERTGTEAVALARFLRLLDALGLVQTDDDAVVHLQELGQLLVKTDPDSDWAWITKEGGLWKSGWDHLLETVRTGAPGFELVHGVSLFDYLEDPRNKTLALRTLQGLSSAGTSLAIERLVEAMPVGESDTVVDVGGGSGQLLFALLRRYPALHGTLFDLPYVVSSASASPEAGRLAGRCSFVGGSFFQGVPASKLYVLQSVLHDWDDQRALAILRGCGSAGEADSRILVIEVFVSEKPGSQSEALDRALRDVNLMVMTRGSKRSADQVQELLTLSGFNKTRIIATGTPFQIIEAAR